jgi:hypothetical protein
LFAQGNRCSTAKDLEQVVSPPAGL